LPHSLGAVKPEAVDTSVGDLLHFNHCYVFFS
jgi:hypothetical protein